MDQMESITLLLFGLACCGAGFFAGINLGLWHERRRVVTHNTNLYVTLPDPLGCEEFDDEAEDDDDEPDYGPDYWAAHRN